MSHHDDVDFVVGGDHTAEGPDGEELAQPQARDPRTRRALAGGAVVLVAGALIARAVSGHHSSTASSSASPSPVVPQASGRFHPPPDVVGSAPIVIPEGNRPTFHRSVSTVTIDCPRFATCSIELQVPDDVLKALHEQFPDAVVASSSSVLANRSGRFEPDLLTRSIVAHAGARTITVTLRKPKRGDDAKSGRRSLNSTATSYYVAITHGFTVSIGVREPRSQRLVDLNHLALLAGDSRLVEPQ
jgi:hypothetical protein